MLNAVATYDLLENSGIGYLCYLNKFSNLVEKAQITHKQRISFNNIHKALYKLSVAIPFCCQGNMTITEDSLLRYQLAFAEFLTVIQPEFEGLRFPLAYGF